MDEQTFKLIARVHAVETFIRDLTVSWILQENDPNAFATSWREGIKKRTGSSTIKGRDAALSDGMSGEIGDAMLRLADNIVSDVGQKAPQ